MVFKAVTSVIDGDLYNPADSYGYFDDVVYMVATAPVTQYILKTYGGNDIVDLRDAAAGNLHFVQSGRGDDTVFGGESEDYVHDTDGNDVALLGGNDDAVNAGAGNDVYEGGAGNDTLSFQNIYNSLGTYVTNTASVKCDLKLSTPQNFGLFGRDVIGGFENVYGGDGNDRLLGTEGINFLSGGRGNDLLEGRDGSDSIDGFFGKDTLIGGLGADTINCGATDVARDHVRYLATNESGVGTSTTVIDRINGFENGGTATDDKIDLSRIDARASTTTVNEAFVFRAGAAFNQVGGEVRLQVIGTDTLVHVDTDADAASEMNFLIFGVTGLTAADFIL